MLSLIVQFCKSIGRQALIFLGGLSALTNAQAEITVSDFSWIKDLNLQRTELVKSPLSKSSQSEARTIVESAIKATSQGLQCGTAQDFAHQAQAIGRESLKSNITENAKNNRYPKLLVLVSFSMPVSTLKVLAKDVNRVGGKLVLRGLVEGNFPKTLKKLQELGEELLIDPTLFETYQDKPGQVERVPTFILRAQNTEWEHEDVPFDVLQGNVSLDYALEQFSLKGEVSGEAKHLLETLRDKS